MPISNKSSENQMTTTSIRINPSEAQRRQAARKAITTERRPVNVNAYRVPIFTVESFGLIDLR